MVQEYAGQYYGETGLYTDRPVNLTAQYVQITSRSLVPRTPRFLLSTFDRPAQAAVEAAQRWGNDELERMRFAVTLRRIVQDAMFPQGGIGRVALVKPTEAAKAAWGPVAGEPVFTRIDREDYAGDPFAGEFHERQWHAHYYRVPLAVAREFKEFTHRKDLEATPAQAYDESGNPRLGTISRGTSYADDEFEEMVGLWEFYLPYYRTVLTLVADAAGQPSLQPNGKPLAETDWVGPETGPYYPLGYQWVSGNADPKGLVPDLFGLDQWANQLLRKLVTDCDSLKEVMLYSDASIAERLRDAPSGSYLMVDDPKAVQSVAFNGAQVQLLTGAFMLARQLFDQMGGNLSLQGGLAPQAKTASQEKMLNANAGAGTADLSETTLRYTSDVLKGLLWFWWKHPFLTMESEHAAPGLPEYPVAERLGPRGSPGLARDLPFDRLRLRVDPYSLQPTSPQEVLAQIREVVKTEVLPMMPLLMQQGTSFDAPEYLHLIGELLNNPRIADVLTLQEPPAGVMGGEGQAGAGRMDGLGMPVATERSYNRINVSEATQGGQERNLMQQLLTGNSPGGANGQPQGMGV